MNKYPPLPSELIFFVTSHCSLQCKHCFNWKNLQRSKDLSLDEIEALARSLPTLKNLMISGGEPFLRKDIVDICRLFARHCRIAAIDIPTSGTLVERTIAAVDEILQIEPSFHLSVGISLDGTREYHDLNRGVPGTFVKAVECCDRLLKMKTRWKKLKVNVLTTLTADNESELIALKEFVAERLPAVDNLYWGVARGETREEPERSISLESLEFIDGEYLKYDNITKGHVNAMTKRFYELRRKAFKEKTQPVSCVAASKIAVVYDEGSVAPCELLPPVGNIRETPFETIWQSQEMRQARADIVAGKCSCTHECFLYPSFEAFLIERPMTLVRLGGVEGLLRWLAAKGNSSEFAWRAKKVAEKITRRRSPRS